MIFSAPVVTIRLTCERKKAILGHFLGNHRLELGKNRLMDPSKIFYGGHCVPHWTWHVPPGRHPGQTLWGVFAGAGRLRVGDEEFSLSAGDVFRLDYQQEVHGIQDRDDWLRIRYVDFEPDDALPVQAMPTSRHFDHLQFLGELFDRLERACRPEQSAEIIIWLEALMTEYQMEASPHRMTLYSAKIDALCRLFQSHPERHYRLEALASQWGCSGDHLIRCFKKERGKTPYAWLLEVRLDTAKVLLRNSNLSLKEIADLCGFSDLFAFSRFFRRRTGQAPGRFARTGRRT